MPLARTLQLAGFAAAIAISATTARSAHAQSPDSRLQVELQWSAPEPCPSHDEVVAEIAVHLGNSHAAVRARATAETTTPVGFRMRVETLGTANAGERVLEGDDCRELASAAALVVAMAARDAPADEPPPPRVRVATVATVSPPIDADSEQPLAQPREHTLAFARALFGGDVGSLPAATPGFALSAGLQRSQWTVGVTASYWMATRAESDNGDAGGDIRLIAADVRGCVSTRVADWCAGAEAGQFRGVGRGVDQPRSATTLWMAASTGLERRFRVGSRAAIVARVDATVPLTRPRFLLDDIGTIHRPAVVSGRALVGVELGLFR